MQLDNAHDTANLVKALQTCLQKILSITGRYELFQLVGRQLDRGKELCLDDIQGSEIDCTLIRHASAP